MKRVAIVVILLLIVAWTSPAPGQWFFPKKAKVNPIQRVPELIVLVKTDADERKRAQAAEELRDFDATTFSEIVPVLADVALHDKKPNVRFEAVTSLARIRPVSQLAGQALEKAAAEDDSLRVRVHAKAALPKYYLAGYSKKAETGAGKKKQTDEPPTGAPPTFGEPLPRLQPLPLLPRPLPPSVATPKTSNAAPVEGPSLFPK